VVEHHQHHHDPAHQVDRIESRPGSAGGMTSISCGGAVDRWTSVAVDIDQPFSLSQESWGLSLTGERQYATAASKGRLSLPYIFFRQGKYRVVRLITSRAFESNSREGPGRAAAMSYSLQWKDFARRVKARRGVRGCAMPKGPHTTMRKAGAANNDESAAGIPGQRLIGLPCSIFSFEGRPSSPRAGVAAMQWLDEPQDGFQLGVVGMGKLRAWRHSRTADLMFLSRHGRSLSTSNDEPLGEPGARSHLSDGIRPGARTLNSAGC